MSKEISVEEYKKIYNRAIKEANIKALDYFVRSKIVALVFISFAFASIPLSIIIEANPIWSFFMFAFFALISIASGWIGNRYSHKEIKEEITDVEALKEACKKLIKKAAQMDIFIFSAMHALALAFVVIWSVWHIIYEWGGSLIFDWITVGISFLTFFFGYTMLFWTEFNVYKIKTSEKYFKEIEKKVENEIIKRENSL